ncbi:peptide methionine sulfoxide reductase MsrB-like isoform X2 [Tubulanus polymorphus]|uniref:peptide methionine sulfoxide reductase MsrB-like isoform X2 n=1 Tax=Tubulanus polymorphus TaxID=672921 RepID=UPI003DA34776
MLGRLIATATGLFVFMNILRIVKDEKSATFKELEASCKQKRPKCDNEQFPKEELKERLTATEYRVTQEGGTEKPFSGKYVNLNEDGIYQCIVCGNHLFSSDAKYSTSCGWPSFFDSLDKSKVTLVKDFSHGLQRIEATCAKCGSHLGHVFDDGPKKQTGVRYCVNSASLEFRKHTTV